MLSHDQAAILASRRLHPGGRNPRSELAEIQALLLADIRNPLTAPSIRAQCARAYEVLEERLRILNGKPLPGQLRPDLEQKRKLKHKPSALISLPTDDTAPAPPACTQVSSSTPGITPAVENKST